MASCLGKTKAMASLCALLPFLTLLECRQCHLCKLFANDGIQTLPYYVRKERLKKLKVVWLIEVSQYDAQRFGAWRSGGSTALLLIRSAKVQI